MELSRGFKRTVFMPHKMTNFPPIIQGHLVTQGKRQRKAKKTPRFKKQRTMVSMIPPEDGTAAPIVAFRARRVKDNAVHTHDSSDDEIEDQLEPLINVDEIRQRRASVDICTQWLMKNYMRPRSVSPKKRPKGQFNLTSIKGTPDLVRKRPHHLAKGMLSATSRALSKSRCGMVDYDAELEAEEDRLRTPDAPRFCATLSPEAQFAMMKGYEDKLAENLGEGHPQTPLPSTSRGTTPADEKRLTMSTPSGGQRIKLSINHEQVENRSNKDASMSRTFQSAMDLLDTLKISQGEMVTSPRNIIRYTNPVHKYKHWSKSWQGEFKVDVQAK